MTNRWERLPAPVAAWIAAGNDPPDAGAIKAFLIERGVEDAEVSVDGEGTIVVRTEHTLQKVRPALDALEPDAPAPEVARRDDVLTALEDQLALIRAIPAVDRSPAETALLLLAALNGLDEPPVAGTG